MIRYIIVDDEPLAREGIRLNADQVPYLEYVSEFGNAMNADEFLKREEVQLIFLDIEMPGINGLEFLRQLKSSHQVILTTAYPQYALESYELDVVDYLVKPIRFERFYKAVSKVQDYLSLQKDNEPSVSEYEEKFMYIKSSRKYVKIFYDDIHYIKGMKDYVVIHTLDKKYMTPMNVKTILSKLPAQQFARVSKSYIVQVKQVLSIDTDTIYTNNYELPLGPSYKEAFVENYVKTNLVSRD